MEFAINGVSNLYILTLLIRWGVGAFFPAHTNTGWYLKLKDVTEPYLGTIRKVIPSFGGFDLSYIVGIVGIKVLSKIAIWIF